ncbi:hypothetical protein G7Y89_g11658 [Cudoniella acicularis]|uniref:Uncharacterized protein n=1 Tax=Cudoniella acicularis TaxID=354080 RepID=A0A8H4VZY3_9HELO|nr:hypothetical protein G7Y89_g11658 [Cudoniella acicularis]
MQFVIMITAFFAAVASVAAIPSPAEFEQSEARDLGISIAKRSLCKDACAVACNSTVLALDQKKCLKICDAKCK